MDGTELTPLSPTRDGELRQTARAVVREWLAAPDPAGVEVGAIGAAAIAAAADQSRRLASVVPAPADAGAVLDALRRLAEGTVAEPPRGWKMFRRPAPPVDAERELGVVVAQLEAQRDTLMRAAVGIASERARIAEADARLEEAAHLLHVLISGAEAAAREIAGHDPARAAALRGPIATRLHERLGDVLTQLAVTRQGRLSLAVIRDGHEVLAAAIDRARSTMVAALRTAAAAGRAVAAGPDRAAAIAQALDQAIAQVASATRPPLD